MDQAKSLYNLEGRRQHKVPAKSITLYLLEHLYSSKGFIFVGRLLEEDGHGLGYWEIRHSINLTFDLSTKPIESQREFTVAHTKHKRQFVYFPRQKIRTYPELRDMDLRRQLTQRTL